MHIVLSHRLAPPAARPRDVPRAGTQAGDVHEHRHPARHTPMHVWHTRDLQAHTRSCHADIESDPPCPSRWRGTRWWWCFTIATPAVPSISAQLPCRLPGNTCRSNDAYCQDSASGKGTLVPRCPEAPATACAFGPELLGAGRATRVPLRHARGGKVHWPLIAVSQPDRWPLSRGRFLHENVTIWSKSTYVSYG
jgi:hypothetical protein